MLRSVLDGSLSAGGRARGLKDSGLRGMGGAGFPTGTKWDLVAGQEATPKYAICNADESEPGTFKDRQILAEQPHLVLEGLLLGMAVCGIEEGWVFIRHEYGPEERRAARGDRARAPPLLEGTGMRVEVFTSPGGYILGEESALIECMEGHRGEPRNKPPFPGIYGLWGKPTLMNSVETFAHVPVILERGADWWRAQGERRLDRAEVLRGVGARGAPGVYCVPMGTTSRELLSVAGGVPGGAEVAGIQPGGASSNFLGPEGLDVPLDFGPVAEAGSMLGSGALVVIAEGTDLLAAATNVLRFFRNESCGKCVPCRVGSRKAHEMLSGLLESGGGVEDVDDTIVQLEETHSDDVDLRAGPGGIGAGDQRAGDEARGDGGAAAPAYGEGARGRGRRFALTRPREQREFFAVRTVGEALAGFRPAHRTATERISLAECLGRVPAEPVTAPRALPGFARATVDGFAVRAADTYGVSDGQPGYLDLAGEARMGRPPDAELRPGAAIAIATGAPLPPGATRW